MIHADQTLEAHTRRCRAAASLLVSDCRFNMLPTPCCVTRCRWAHDVTRLGRSRNTPIRAHGGRDQQATARGAQSLEVLSRSQSVHISVHKVMTFTKCTHIQPCESAKQSRMGNIYRPRATFLMLSCSFLSYAHTPVVLIPVLRTTGMIRSLRTL